MAHATALVEVGNSRAGLAKLPLFRIYVLGNGLGSEEGF